jgi:cysteine-rich repeat protein
MSKTRVVASWLLGLALLTSAAVVPRPTSAAVCNGFVQINYVVEPEPAFPGDLLRVQMVLFSGTIDDGENPVLIIDRVRFSLDCSVDAALGLPCTDDGNVVSYLGNITSSGCLDADSSPGSFTDNSAPGNVTPNELVFTPSAPIVMAQDTPLNGGCFLEFDVRVMSYSNDSSPSEIEEVGGFRLVAGVPDAQCSNELPSIGSQSVAIMLATLTPTPTATSTATPTATPTVPLQCGDGVVTSPETCDPPESLWPPNNNPCRADCTFCGDGIVNGLETCDDGNSNNKDACHNDCTRPLRNDPAWIRIRSGGQLHDRLYVHGRFEADHSVDPTALLIGVRLSNASGEIFSAYVPVGGVSGRKVGGRSFFRFQDPGARTSPAGGVTLFKVVKDARWYRVNAWAWGDISAATADMTMEVFFGHEQYTSQGTWKRTRRGWHLFIK